MPRLCLRRGCGSDTSRRQQPREKSPALVAQARWRGADVAVKMFVNEYRNDADGNLSNFRAELQIMADHVSQGSQRLVRLMGACLTPPNICIIYEFVPGGSLHERIHKNKAPLPYLEVLGLSRDIAEGLVSGASGRRPGDSLHRGG